MHRRNYFIILTVTLLAPAGVRACSIPVFRYALERWQPSAYEVVLFHRGGLDPAATAVAQRLADGRDLANFRLVEVDLAKPVDPAIGELWKAQEPSASLPWVIVRQPESVEERAVIWQAKLSEENVGQLLNSATRRKLAAALGSGTSAVYVLLESGNAMKDDAASMLVERELARLQKIIELPMPTVDGPQLLSELPLRLSFQVLRVPRTDPAERFFVACLLHSEEGLARATGPILMPIFGRGRLLCTLHGDDLCAEGIEKATRFLCGACSCQVKDLNPGVDLLLQADWTAMIGETKTEAGPAANPLKPGAHRQKFSAVKFDDGVVVDVAEVNWSWWLLRVGIGLAGALVLLTGVWALRSRIG